MTVRCCGRDLPLVDVGNGWVRAVCGACGDVHEELVLQDSMAAEPRFHGPQGYTGPVDLVRCGLCDGWGRHDYGACDSCNRTGWRTYPKERAA